MAGKARHSSKARNHYVHQGYLSRFASRKNGSRFYIWVYDKAQYSFVETNISNIAAERGFYLPEDETKLDKFVEDPSKRIIDKLIRQEPINEGEREQFSHYLAVTLKRVPANRQRGRDLYPKVLDKTFDKVDSFFRMLEKLDGVDRALVAFHRQAAQYYKQQFQIEAPPQVHDIMLSPWPTKRLVETIKSMSWNVLSARGPTFLLTSNNPVFFFSAYGLENEESELCFPLSTNSILLCNRQRREDLGFGVADETLVCEMNRRVASEATRYVFYHRPETWVQTLAMKQAPYLSRVFLTCAKCGS